MKVRWTRQSVRLRITPSEMEAILRGEPVGEELVLPGGGHWGVEIHPGAEKTAITLDGSRLHLHLSEEDGKRLAVPEAEGVYFHLDGDPPVPYFIEKDFPCAHPRAAEALEPISETFAAPEGFQTRKAPAAQEGITEPPERD